MAVDSPAAVHRTLARAVEAGATVLRPVTQLGYAGSHAFFADPDGHVWEVIQTPGLEVDEAGALSLP
ncbi:MAG TPA: VOC family protein [Acidimicrobiales bacterium]|nr:VOC family protein [Acidimicrobiales bacterium]